MTEDFVAWLTDELNKRGWSNSELARRARVAPSTVSMVISQQNRPGWDFCAGVGRAFGEPPEKIFRLAGLLPSLPPAVAEEGEAIGLFRRLSDQARAVVMTTMRSLLGLSIVPGNDGPRTFDELLAYHIEHQGQYLTMEEQRAVFDLMKTLRDRGEAGMPSGIEVEPD